MTSARRTPAAAGGATVSIRGGGETVATTSPPGGADWRSGGAAGPGESDGAARFAGMTVEGGIASPVVGAPDGVVWGAGAEAGGIAPAFAFGDAGLALRSAVSSMARRSRAVAWARVAASPRASAAIAA